MLTKYIKNAASAPFGVCMKVPKPPKAYLQRMYAHLSAILTRLAHPRRGPRTGPTCYRPPRRYHMSCLAALSSATVTRCGCGHGRAPQPPSDVTAGRLGSAPKTAPGDADGSPRNSRAPAVSASNVADDRARPPGVRRRTKAEAPAAGCANRGHRSSARDGTWQASRQPRGERGAKGPTAVPEQLLGGSGRAYLPVHVQRDFQAYGPCKTCRSEGCKVQSCCAQRKKAQQRAATR